MPEQTIVCPQCKGRGWVIDRGMAVIANIFYPVFRVMDKAMDAQLFEKECPRCDGEGWIEIGQIDR